MKPLATMKVEVREVEAIISFIEQINSKELEDDEIATLENGFDQKLSDLDNEKLRRKYRRR